MRDARYRILLGAAVYAALVGCGGSGGGAGTITAPPPPPVDTTPTGPPAVTILAASLAYPDYTHTAVTLHLKNTGGPGTYYLTFWKLATPATYPNPRNMGSSLPVTVTAAYDEVATFRVTVPEGDHAIDYVTVSNAGPNTATYTAGQCYLITAGLSKCPP